MGSWRQAPWQPRPWAIVAYLVVFVPAALIATTYTNPQTRPIDLDAVIPGFYSHASNLLLSYGVIVSYGLFRLVYGAGLREVAIVTAVVIAANYVYEVGLTLWNTRDIVDAHYGAVASLLTFALLAAIKLYGLKPSDRKERTAESSGQSVGAHER